MHGQQEDVWLELLRGAQLDVPKSSIGWQLSRYLRENQGTGSGDGDHILVVGLSQRQQDLLIQRDSNVIRSSVRLVGDYVLLGSGNEEIAEGRVLVSAGYNRVGDGFANEVALRDAEERAARELAGRIWRRLVLSGME